MAFSVEQGESQHDARLRSVVTAIDRQPSQITGGTVTDGDAGGEA